MNIYTRAFSKRVNMTHVQAFWYSHYWHQLIDFNTTIFPNLQSLQISNSTIVLFNTTSPIKGRSDHCRGQSLFLLSQQCRSLEWSSVRCVATPKIRAR